MEPRANPSLSVERSLWSHSGWRLDPGSGKDTATALSDLESEEAESAALEVADIDIAVHWCTVYALSSNEMRWARRRAQRAAVPRP
jgi:hypothetical protein